MKELLWFHGITWDTPLRDIGWTYVVMLAIGGVLIYVGREIFRPRKHL